MAECIIIDDTGRVNKTTPITPAIQLELAKMGRVVPAGMTFLPLIDDKTKRVVQDKVETKRVYSDAHLDITIKRAARFIRSDKFRDRVPPARHIAFALAVFNKHDRDGFKEAVNSAHA